MRKNGNSGFTLIETIIATGLFLVLVSGFSSFLMVSNVSIKKMEEGIMYRSQYQRAFNFMVNTIRKNEKRGVIAVYDGNRLVMALNDEPGMFLHYFVEEDRLLMYIGREKSQLPVFTEEMKKKNVMTLADGIDNIQFDLGEDPQSRGRRLLFRYAVDENGDGTPELHEDLINIYVSD